MASQKRFYWVWVVAGLVIAIPEISAAAKKDWFPFTTISEMVGHLEYRKAWVALIVIAIIVWVVMSLFQFPPGPGPRMESAAPPPERTPGGRVTIRSDQAAIAGPEATGPLFALATWASFVVIGVLTWLTVALWNDPREFRASYMLYGLIALFWLVIPSAIALIRGRDVPFPTLFQSVTNLRRWLDTNWGDFGKALGWLTSYVIIAGLTVLLLHLVLYPFPDIAKTLNPDG
jgi:hypothetical protein